MDALKRVWVAVWLFPAMLMAQTQNTTAPTGSNGVRNTTGTGAGTGGGWAWWWIIAAIIVIALIWWASASRTRRGPPAPRAP